MVPGPVPEILVHRIEHAVIDAQPSKGPACDVAEMEPAPDHNFEQEAAIS